MSVAGFTPSQDIYNYRTPDIAALASELIDEENLDSKQIRTSNLDLICGAHSTTNMKLLIDILPYIPIIGWIAYGIIKWHVNVLHRAGETAMSDFKIQTSLEGRVQVIEKAIQVTGFLAWQYRLTLAQVYLLHQKNNEAAKQLKLVQEQRGPYNQNGSSNVRDIYLVSFKRQAHYKYEDPDYVMEVDYYNALEAALNVALHTRQGNLEKAYEASNQVLLYDRNINVRRLQKSLANEMGKSVEKLSQRGVEIIQAEAKHTENIDQFLQRNTHIVTEAVLLHPQGLYQVHWDKGEQGRK